MQMVVDIIFNIQYSAILKFFDDIYPVEKNYCKVDNGDGNQILYLGYRNPKKNPETSWTAL